MSVVVLNWNGQDMTVDCLHSLMAMSHVEYNITVVDNGSNDNSIETIRQKFPDVQIIANKQNLGFALGCNVAMEEALKEQGYDYILLVNNDTIIDPDLLAELVQEADRCPKAAICSPKIYYYEPRDLLWWAGGTYSPWTGMASHLGRRQQDKGQYDSARDLDWATGCVMLLRVKALREVGLFDAEIFATSEDVDLSLRIREAGYVIRYVPLARVWHREGVDLRKNVGERFRFFMFMRNTLWVLHKHARFYHWFTCWPALLGYYIPRTLIARILRRDFGSCWGLLCGLAAFWRMLLHPNVSTLPEAFGAPESFRDGVRVLEPTAMAQKLK
ncbi:MAG TPA: glycosyltransferase family 2 protein [Terriglobales bacterium]|nr:glycosyltransferase family 2 protein [Terriglobales bacterium]